MADASAIWAWISDPKNQATLAWIGGAVVAAAGSVAGFYFTYIKPRRAQDEPANADDAIAGVGEIAILVGGVDFNLEIFAQRFRKVRPGEASIDGWMIDDKGCCPLHQNVGFFKILKYDLARSGFSYGDPYKFYCRVPNQKETIDKCYALLCRQEYIVTGKGKTCPDDDKFYQVWFVSGREPVFPNARSLYFLNNKFDYKARAS
jgi:hypothetical protein